jgi:hypothetical protein
MDARDALRPKGRNSEEAEGLLLSRDFGEAIVRVREEETEDFVVENSFPLAGQTRRSDESLSRGQNCDY